MYCKHTLTGVKFLLVADAGVGSGVIEAVQKRMYELYSDYALKNPFYILENPIVRCVLLDNALQSLVREAGRGA
jgi:hypothetical protein